MPDFKPIFTGSDLPRPRIDRESNVLDFKAYVRPTTEEQKTEIAKDVASFANADGGSIVYGAIEAAGGLLDSYAPIALEADAESFRQSVRDIAKTRCSPPLTIDVRTLARDGGWVVVANVFSAPGQATGVTLRWDVRQTGKRIDTYFFPIRVGDSSDPEILNPEQIAMLMIPSLRRTLSMLRQIDIAGKEVVYVHENRFTQDTHPMRPAGRAMVLIELSELGNFAHFVPKDGQDKDAVPYVVPLDAVQIIYRRSGAWHLLIEYLTSLTTS